MSEIRGKGRPKNVIVVLTALPVEFKAVRTLLDDRKQQPHPQGTVFTEGVLRGTGWRIALARVGKGNERTAVIAERAREMYAPYALFFVGVAGGLTRDVKLGDVVVATAIHHIGPGKEGPDGFRATPIPGAVSHLLEQYATAALADDAWHEWVPEPTQAVPDVHFETIAAADVVLNSTDSPLREQLKFHYADTKAIEMESAGITRAAELSENLRILTIRGISDHADGRKAAADATGSQPRAAAHAVAAMAAVIAALPTPGSDEGGHVGGDHIDLRGSVFHGLVTGKIGELHVGRGLPATPPESERDPLAVEVGRVGAVLGGLFGPLGERAVRPAPTARDAVQRETTAGGTLLADCVREMDQRAGDGAVTAALLAAALIDETGRRCTAGASAFALKNEAAQAMKRVRAELARLSVPCADPAAVTASAATDRDVAEAVAAAARQAGPDGVLICEPGDGQGIEAVSTRAVRLPVGYESPHAVTDAWYGEARLVRPYVLLLGAPLEPGPWLHRLLDEIAARDRRLLTVIAEPQAHLLGALRETGNGPVPPVVRVVRAHEHRFRLRDLATLTGGTVAKEIPSFDQLGQADLAVVTARRTLLAGTGGKPALIERWTDSVRRRRADGDGALDERLAWLTGQGVRLRVGVDSVDRLAVRTHQAERAAHSAQAALRRGTVPGGGLALLLCRRILDEGTDRPGTAAVRAALSAPFRRLARSARLRVEIDRLADRPDGPVALDVRTGAMTADPPFRDATEIVDLALETAMVALDRFVSHART